MAALVLALSISYVGATDGSRAARVVVLANHDDPDSLRIAEHYAEVRGVPTANIITLKLPLTESITWREFVTTLWQPLLDQLVQSRWIDAIPMALSDAVGRRKYAPHSHRLEALVVCRGVPLEIAHDPVLYASGAPSTTRAEFRVNAAAVDAELSLLATPNYPINAFVSNPLFQNDQPTSAQRGAVVKVARLDGPTAAQALALVDRAVTAERTGLLGRAYIDLSDREALGNGWLEHAAAQLEQLGFAPTVDREPATFPITARMDAPVLYFGWYAGDLNGPFALPGFQFPPGAIAVHIHSFSAATLRSVANGWTGPLVARGVTATVGNVHEPYLEFTHQPHLLLRALARGDTLAEAAYYALPVLSWQAILIGDPLYRPFAASLDPRPESIGAGPPALLSGYAVLRRMHQLENAGRRVEAAALGHAAQRQAPSLAVAVALGRRLIEAGNLTAAASALSMVTPLQTLAADEWALAREAAQLLEACGQRKSAVDIWRRLLASVDLPREVRLPWLRDAQKTALGAGESGQAGAWEREIEALNAPPAR